MNTPANGPCGTEPEASELEKAPMVAKDEITGTTT
jgi:hypothetical protein